MQWELRPAGPHDLEFLFDVHRQALGPYVEQTWGWDDEAQRVVFATAFPEANWKVIVVDQRPVGGVRTSESDEEVCLEDIEILPAFQRRGTGTAVIRSIIDEATRSRKPVRLQVLRVNPARRLYERLGFAVIGEDEVHIRMRRPLSSRA